MATKKLLKNSMQGGGKERYLRYMPKKPSKQLIGRCVKVMKCQANQGRASEEGVVTNVDDEGMITVVLGDNYELMLSWDKGDRWTVIPLA